MNTKTVSVLLLTLSLGSLAAAPNEIGFVEQFVLADDRQAALADLVPGTEEYYYFHALHYQHTAQDKKLETLITNWTERHRNSDLRTTIHNRQALLDYDKDPVGSITYLKKQLRLSFDHTRDIPEEERQLPSELDPATISAETFYTAATTATNDLGKLNDAGLAWVLATGKQLTTTQRRDLLSRIQRPDHPNLLDHIIADLKTKNAPKFGGHKIHRQLLLGQLDTLRKALPTLANNETFVLTYLGKLRPGADDSLTRDPATHAAYIDRARAFTNTLGASFNSLKAHLLYHQLLLQSAADTYERAAFLQYLKLPRQVPYLNPQWRKDEGALWNNACNLNHDFSNTTGLPPIRDESSLVRSFLLHFLTDENSTKPFARYLSDRFLDPLFAEAKITSGKGDPESHASALSPAAFAALRDRVDLEFAPSNAKVFKPGDDVSLDLFVKNIPDLIVKVYEINAFNVYQQTGIEIGTDLDLDGLVPNTQTAHQHTETPYQRVRRSFAFPGLKNRRGTWVVEFVGNGISSRALVRKGTLTSLEDRTAAGHALTVIDEDRNVRTDVSAHSGGREYTPDEDGTIFVPYSTNPGKRTVVLADPTGFAALSTLNHRAEEYQLTAGFHVERESLLPGKTATLAISPNLTVAGAPAALSVLEDITVVIGSTDIDGNDSTTEFKIPELPESGALLQEFVVPARTSQLGFAIAAKARLLTTGEKVDLEIGDTITLNTNIK
ncbi:MAG: hypothetical protein P8J87_18740, partial [Verrucomicrobiales bacterium]|nr:hypothetical protein [Verrucomicrobiales bacterium]